MAREVIYDKGGSLSTIDALLKDDYITNEIREIVNKSTYMLTQITAEETTYGRRFMFPVQTNLHQNAGARGENVVLPDPGFGEYEQAMGTVKYLYSSMYITGQSISATKNNKAAFANALKTAMRDTQESLKQDLNRQVWGDGTGVLGVVSAVVTASAVIPVTDPYGLDYVAADLTNREKVMTFKRGMNLYIASGAGVYVTVIQVNHGAGTITVSQAVTLTLGALIYKGDAVGRTSVNNEITGINGFMGVTGSYLGLDRDGIPEWQANINEVGTGTGGPITEEAMRITRDMVAQNGNGETELIVTNYTTRRRYEALLTSERRQITPMKLQGGYTALEFDGLPLTVDKDVPPQRMYFLRTSDINWMVMEDTDWIKEDGQPLKWVRSKDAYEAVLRTYRDLVTKAPANQAVLFGVIAEA